MVHNFGIVLESDRAVQIVLVITGVNEVRHRLREDLPLVLGQLVPCLQCGTKALVELLGLGDVDELVLARRVPHASKMRVHLAGQVPNIFHYASTVFGANGEGTVAYMATCIVPERKRAVHGLVVEGVG